MAGLHLFLGRGPGGKLLVTFQVPEQPREERVSSSRGMVPHTSPNRPCHRPRACPRAGTSAFSTGYGSPPRAPSWTHTCLLCPLHPQAGATAPSPPRLHRGIAKNSASQRQQLFLHHRWGASFRAQLLTTPPISRVFYRTATRLSSFRCHPSHQPSLTTHISLLFKAACPCTGQSCNDLSVLPVTCSPGL